MREWRLPQDVDTSAVAAAGQAWLSSTEMHYDEVFKAIGSFGDYQKRVCLLQALPVVFGSIQTYLSIFILYSPEHR